MNLETFVLAGGKSSRMGRDKGLVAINGKSLISYILEKLKKTGLPTSIIANNENYQNFGIPVYEDLVKEKGPIGGLYTAFEKTKAEAVFLISCDMPLIPLEALKEMISFAKKDEIFGVSVEGRINPLFAIYPVQLKHDVAERIASGRLKMTDLISENKHTLVTSIAAETPWVFQNINDDAELRNLKKKWNHLL